jgi:hypothetical protein
VIEAVDFWYPLSPTEPIEEGRKLVRFDPPAETLSGERIHQWLGARLRPDRASSDLERIERQQVFVRTLLDDGFDFGRVLARSQLVSASSEAAVQELEQVTSEWSFETLGPVAPETIDGMMVLVLRKSRLPWRG